MIKNVTKELRYREENTMSFESAVMELISIKRNQTKRKPYILFSHIKELYKMVINGKVEKCGYADKIENKMYEIENLLSSFGYDEQGINAVSKIGKNLLSSLSKECPKLISKNSWLGLNDDIFDNPLLVNDICNKNKKAKEFLAAFFYLNFICRAYGRIFDRVSIKPDDKWDQGYLDKADILCPNEEWITDAKDSNLEFKKFYLELKEIG